MLTVSLIVPAAGCGSRAGTNGNKILAPLGGQPLLFHTLGALLAPSAYEPDFAPLELILAARRDEFALIQPILDQLKNPYRMKTLLVEGGATRQESVHNAIRATRGDLLLVHDAARPLVSPVLIKRTLQAARQGDAALAALPCPDTVKQATYIDDINGSANNSVNNSLDRKSNGSATTKMAPIATVTATLDRSTLWLAQTPQIFRRTLLLEAFDAAAREGFSGTDCASLVEHLGHSVQLVPGEARNFKVTYPDDLERAAALL